jgi:hypothetical protein
MQRDRQVARMETAKGRGATESRATRTISASKQGAKTRVSKSMFAIGSPTFKSLQAAWLLAGLAILVGDPRTDWPSRYRRRKHLFSQLGNQNLRLFTNKNQQYNV